MTRRGIVSFLAVALLAAGWAETARACAPLRGKAMMRTACCCGGAMPASQGCAASCRMAPETHETLSAIPVTPFSDPHTMLAALQPEHFSAPALASGDGRRLFALDRFTAHDPPARHTILRL